MPIYPYRCKLCGHQFDAIRKVDHEPLKECPRCDKPGLERLVGSSAFRLKGSGWFGQGGKK